MVRQYGSIKTEGAFFNTQTLQPIKTVQARGADGYLFDPFTHHFIILSHGAPNLHVFDSKDGTDVGTVDAIGKDGSNAAVEQGATDGQGNLYFDVEDQGCIAVVDAKTLKVTAEYPWAPKGPGMRVWPLTPRTTFFLRCAVGRAVAERRRVGRLPVGRLV